MGVPHGLGDVGVTHPFLDLSDRYVPHHGLRGEGVTKHVRGNPAVLRFFPLVRASGVPAALAALSRTRWIEEWASGDPSSCAKTRPVAFFFRG